MGASTKNCEYIKKEKLEMKIFFQIMLNEVLKIVKAHIKQ